MFPRKHRISNDVLEDVVNGKSAAGMTWEGWECFNRIIWSGKMPLGSVCLRSIVELAVPSYLAQVTCDRRDAVE